MRMLPAFYALIFCMSALIARVFVLEEGESFLPLWYVVFTAVCAIGWYFVMSHVFKKEGGND